MTRINVVPEDTLTNKHLSGEFHEISRVFNLVRKAIARDTPVVIPKYYLLGRGHVTFFYDKLGYISERYLRLGLELSYRAYSSGRVSSVNIAQVLNLIEQARNDIPDVWWGEYTPTQHAIDINRKRLRERS